MGAALGLGLRPGDAVVSLGTSGTVFGVSDTDVGPERLHRRIRRRDRAAPATHVHAQRARVLVAAAQMLDVDLDELGRLALAAAPGAGGLSLLPYLDGEHPGAAGGDRHPRRADPQERDAAEPRPGRRRGDAVQLADGVDSLRGQGAPVERVLLIGGAAASPAV